MPLRALRHIRLHLTRFSVVSRPFVLLAALAPAALTAQGSAIPTADPAVQRAMAAMQAHQAWTLEQQISICEVPAPPFMEQRRAEEFRRRLISFGYPDTRIDSIGNVIAEIGRGDGPTVMTQRSSASCTGRSSTAASRRRRSPVLC